MVRVDGSTVYLLTDHEAPLRRVVAVDLDAVTPGKPDGRLVDVVPEAEGYARAGGAAGDELLAVHLVDVQPQVTRCTLDGKARHRWT